MPNPGRREKWTHRDGAHRHDEGAQSPRRARVQSGSQRQQLGKAEAEKRPMTGVARRPRRKRANASTAFCVSVMVLETLAAIESTDRGRMVRAYAAIRRRRLGSVCCRRANGALRFVLTIDYGPSLPPTEIITRGLIDPILTRRGASERLPRAENRCAVRLQF